MKRITIACLASEKQAAVETLQGLGTLHVVPFVQPASEDLDALRRKQAQLSRVLSVLRPMAPAKNEATDACDGEAALSEAWDTLENLKKREGDLQELRHSIRQLEPWGDFSEEQLESLKTRGVHLALCACPESRLPALPERTAMVRISETSGTVYFAVVSDHDLSAENLPLAQLPHDKNLQAWRNREAEALDAIGEAQRNLEKLAASAVPSLEALAQDLGQRLAFVQARDGMDEKNAIAYLKGYVPVDKVDGLREAARLYGWAIRYEDIPEDDTDVPTNLIIPRRFRMAKAIFDFVGILPGYRETDVSVSVLLFLALFAGMLVGDAGYGMLFTLGVLWLRRRHQDAESRLGLNALLVMSIAILAYGALSCNWFAIPVDKMPRWMKPIPWLCNENSQKNVQLLCFFIGASHMTLARLWRSLQTLASVNPQEDTTWSFLLKLRGAVGHLGWGFFLWANFGMTRLLIVKGGGVGDLEPVFIWLYLIGFILILTCSVNWTNMGDVIYMPFTFINNFVDVLSYIRLFAVGLSSMYIADSFNGMALSLNSELGVWSLLTIPAALLILAIGHALNIALAVMGVLVHGIRLNTLEFSGHMDLSWSGKAYKPLRKN